MTTEPTTAPAADIAKLTFDEATFKAAYAADPVGVAAKFTSGTTSGFAARVQQAAKNASEDSR